MQTAFQKLKELLNTDTVLAHVDRTLPIGISCHSSEVGQGVALFHRYQNSSECPIAKTLTETQRLYSQIQKEALAIVFKYDQFLYGQKFILVGP